MGAGLVACSSDSGAGSASESVTFIGGGGQLQEAQTKAYFRPFEKGISGIKVVQDTGSTNPAKLVAAIQAGSVSWDLADVGSDFGTGDQQKLLQPFDCSVVECPPGEPTTYRLPLHAYASVLAYNPSKVSGEPNNWTDFFDVKKFPGKRALFKHTGPTGVFEAALLADGVPADKLYPLDIDRALKKLGTIKSSIVWATSPTQTTDLVAGGVAVMGNVFSSQAYAQVKNGGDIKVAWDGMGLGMDYLVIPKGAPHVANANKLAAYMTDAATNADLAKIYPAGPGNPKAQVDKTAATFDFLPTPDKSSNNYTLDGAWYASNYSTVTPKFQRWLQQ
ncbi:extracellular solute-binding protein [Streptomyces sp. MMS24-I29]|uniref:extracellular solute-binding protein n=1 Tax=Streptomyces sp. MMS24-I29 TaxID=3351480 RepID=UPI003C7CBC4E